MYPKGAVIIDAAHDKADARRFGFDRFNPRAYARVLRALDQASAIVVTHEHGDHLGGVLESAHLASLLPRLLLTREQLTSPEAPQRAGTGRGPAGGHQGSGSANSALVLVPGHDATAIDPLVSQGLLTHGFRF